MEIETLDAVLKYLRTKKNRQVHLLLGNGFSIAFDSKIFSYNSLHDFISKTAEQDLSRVLGVIDSKNFEEVMRYLDKFVALLDAFSDKSDLSKRIASLKAKLERGLLDAVQSLHPEHVFSLEQAQQKSCSRFLMQFLDAGGKIFSSNYDLLLYWVLLRTSGIRHCDGFGRDLENPEEVKLGGDEHWSNLRWGKHRDEQNVFYLHGALPIFDNGIDVEKEEYTDGRYLLTNISERMDRGEYPIFVTAGNGRQKLEQIMHNRYLSYCYERFCELTGSLVTFGFNFGPYDDHFIEAINKAANQRLPNRLWSIYIGVYSAADKAHIEQIADKFACKVHLFDAKSVDVWGTR
ncbi:DUF4917 family protein [bacterium]|nr:DUF4917 family protein [bacterium]